MRQRRSLPDPSTIIDAGFPARSIPASFAGRARAARRSFSSTARRSRPATASSSSARRAIRPITASSPTRSMKRGRSSSPYGSAISARERDLPDRVPNARADAILNLHGDPVVFANDGASFLYARLDENHRARSIWRHRHRHAMAHEDRLVLEEATPGWFVSVHRERTGRHASIAVRDHETSEAFILDLDRPDASPRLVAPRDNRGPLRGRDRRRTVSSSAPIATGPRISRSSRRRFRPPGLRTGETSWRIGRASWCCATRSSRAISPGSSRRTACRASSSGRSRAAPSTQHRLRRGGLRAQPRRGRRVRHEHLALHPFDARASGGDL